jgi:hypothetical protein
MNDQSKQGTQRNEEHRGQQQEQERQSNTGQERGSQRQGPDPTPLDKEEGNMEHGELGGNFRKEDEGS